MPGGFEQSIISFAQNFDSNECCMKNGLHSLYPRPFCHETFDLTTKRPLLAFSYFKHDLFLNLGLTNITDDLQQVLNIMKILSSKNADQKISATATMTSSQAKSSKLDSTNLLKNISGKVPTIDVKNCFCYLFHNTSSPKSGIDYSTINSNQNRLALRIIH